SSPTPCGTACRSWTGAGTGASSRTPPWSGPRPAAALRCGSSATPRPGSHRASPASTPWGRGPGTPAASSAPPWTARGRRWRSWPDPHESNHCSCDARRSAPPRRDPTMSHSALLLLLALAQPAEDPKIVVHRDVVYGRVHGAALLADLAHPDGKG